MLVKIKTGKRKIQNDKKKDNKVENVKEDKQFDSEVERCHKKELKKKSVEKNLAKKQKEKKVSETEEGAMEDRVNKYLQSNEEVTENKINRKEPLKSKKIRWRK